jgi:hypothetical protein
VATAHLDDVGEHPVVMLGQAGGEIEDQRENREVGGDGTGERGEVTPGRICAGNGNRRVIVLRQPASLVDRAMGRKQASTCGRTAPEASLTREGPIGSIDPAGSLAWSEGSTQLRGSAGLEPAFPAQVDDDSSGLGVSVNSGGGEREEVSPQRHKDTKENEAPFG